MDYNTLVADVEKLNQMGLTNEEAFKKLSKGSEKSPDALKQAFYQRQPKLAVHGNCWFS